ncbi:MAG TPA: HEAT repeat domain-containing protein [Polyangia bacterium]
MRSWGGRRQLLLISGAAAVALVLGPSPSPAADPVARAAETLRTGRNFKVRVQAASALARMRDRRVAQELARAALADRNPAVRTYAVRLLGKLRGDDVDAGVVRGALERALKDRRAEVRAAAQQSLALVGREPKPITPPVGRPGETLVAVRAIGDRSGRASAAVKAALRSALLASLQRDRGVRIVDGNAAANYVIDGTIARLVLNNAGMDVESTIGVELVVSRPPRGIVLIASGEASVTEPRMTFRPDRRASLEATAVEHAVKSAHENLARFFATAR